MPEPLVSLFRYQACSSNGDLQGMLGRILLQSYLSESVRAVIHPLNVAFHVSPSDDLAPVIGSRIRRCARVKIEHDPMCLRIQSLLRRLACVPSSNLSHMYIVSCVASDLSFYPLSQMC